MQSKHYVLPFDRYYALTISNKSSFQDTQRYDIGNYDFYNNALYGSKNTR